MEHWKEALLALLKHFDANEGTTYLYSEEARRQFLEDVDPAIRPEVSKLLDEYHRR